MAARPTDSRQPQHQGRGFLRFHALVRPSATTPTPTPTALLIQADHLHVPLQQLTPLSLRFLCRGSCALPSLEQPAPEPDIGGHRGRGAAVPVVSPAAGRCRRFKPRELDGFVFNALQDELVVDDVYLRVLVRDAERQRAVGGDGDARKVAAEAAGLGQGLALPSDLLVREGACEGCDAMTPTHPFSRGVCFVDLDVGPVAHRMILDCFRLGGI